jgi:hypothetical protein
VGSTVGGLIGAVVGFFTPIGPQFGAAIGSFLGGVVHPQKIYGPRLTDATQQTSQEGIPIPFGYGSFPCSGNIIFAGPVDEHEHDDNGKGGPVSVTYTYTRSYAIGICKGPANLAVVKRRDKVIYDVRPGSDMEAENAKFFEEYTFYDGGETQLVDPTIEAIKGVNNSGPNRGLAYLVRRNGDVTESRGAIEPYEFVMQVCGDLSVTMPEHFIGTGGSPDEVLATNVGETWTSRGWGASGHLRYTAAAGNTVVATDDDGYIWRSADRGQTATAVAGPFVGLGKIVAAGENCFVAYRDDAGTIKSLLSVDDGATWNEVGTIVSTFGANDLCYGNGVLLFSCGTTNNGIYYSINKGFTWLPAITGYDFAGLGFNGDAFLSTDSFGDLFYSALGVSGWTPSGGSVGASGYAITGEPGYFIVGTFENGIYRTTSFGTSPSVLVPSGTSSARFYSAASGNGVSIIGSGGGGSNTQYRITNNGLTATLINPAIDDVGLSYLAPAESWIEVPDAPGVYVDEDGNVITGSVATYELTTCAEVLEDIVKDLCSQSNIDPDTEVEASQLSDIVKGFKCAAGSGANGYLASLGGTYFFDWASYDKKIHFIKRGGAPVASIDTDDLVLQDGPPISQERSQESDLPRKVNVISLDPAQEFNATKQTWERRSNNVQAVGEATVEVPVVLSADDAAQLAEKTVKISWAESDTFAFALPVSFSELTPTDVVTLTDEDGVLHRIRLEELQEEAGVLNIVRAIKDRASLYTGTASGSTNPNSGGGNVPGLIGPALFVAMNLPQLRAQDGSGMYVGVCGLLPGFRGAQVLLSIDGGISYSVALTVTSPTKLGKLTYGITAGGSPLSVHMFSGDLSSATTAQVAAGINAMAVLTEDSAGEVAEILAYEVAAETTPGYYDLSTLSRGLKGTDAADHFNGDWAMDLATCYFLPIDPAYAGTVWFKAVPFGVSSDAVTPVSYDYEPEEIIHDGGVVTP